MRQVVQTNKGEVKLLEVPPPQLRAGGVLVRTVASVISPGTERTNVERSRRSLLERARERPDLVKAVLTRVKREGILATFRSVQEKLDAFVPMGYSSSGVVEAVGEGVRDLQVGDWVACAGGGFAVHAELAWVPERLCAKVPRAAAGGPDPVSLESAAFATLGAIALHGVRQAAPRVGETVGVIGLGLLGQFTVQLLRANGVRVVASDLDAGRRELAAAAGATVAAPGAGFEDVVRQATRGRGADAVIITAATESTEPVREAGVVARDRAVVVIVGAVPATLPRSPYYEKELELRFSRSYGPGRYDPAFEEQGNDYPIGYVRWTEQRNLEGVLDLLADGKVDVAPLVTRRYAIGDAEQAYADLTGGGAASLGLVLTYPEAPARVTRRELRSATVAGAVGVGLVGAGAFGRDVLIPALKAAGGIDLRGVAAGTGLTATSVAQHHGFAFATTDLREILADGATHAVFIATRHHLHAEQVIAALEAGKHVFVEKPLCLTWEESARIESAWRRAQATGPRHLLVGFNRRFAPTTARLCAMLAGRKRPLQVRYRINAGAVPLTSWVHDPAVGGGRLLGEGCHFIDLVSTVVGARPTEVYAAASAEDSLSVVLRYPDGSVGAVDYLAEGHPSVPKERLEVVGGGASYTLDDFTALRWAAPAGSGAFTPGGQDKGHRAEIAAFLAAVRGEGPAPVPFEDLLASTRATLSALDSIRTGAVIPLEG